MALRAAARKRAEAKRESRKRELVGDKQPLKHFFDPQKMMFRATFPESNFAAREANPRRRCASPKSLFFDFDEENNLYGDYVHMDGKARRYSAAVMRAAAAWLREVLAALSECVSAP